MVEEEVEDGTFCMAPFCENSPLKRAKWHVLIKVIENG